MTLTELSVSMGVLSIVVALSASFAGNMNGKRMEASALHFYSIMQRTRNIAMTENRYAAVYIEGESDEDREFFIVRDGNLNGVLKKDIDEGIDIKKKTDFNMEQYPGVKIKKITFPGERIISFSPDYRSSTGSIYFETEEKEDGVVRLKLYGPACLLRPVRLFPDGREKQL